MQHRANHFRQELTRDHSDGPHIFPVKSHQELRLLIFHSPKPTRSRSLWTRKYCKYAIYFRNIFRILVPWKLFILRYTTTNNCVLTITTCTTYKIAIPRHRTLHSLLPFSAVLHDWIPQRKTIFILREILRSRDIPLRLLPYIDPCVSVWSADKQRIFDRWVLEYFLETNSGCCKTISRWKGVNETFRAFLRLPGSCGCKRIQSSEELSWPLCWKRVFDCLPAQGPNYNLGTGGNGRIAPPNTGHHCSDRKNWWWQDSCKPCFQVFRLCQRGRTSIMPKSHWLWKYFHNVVSLVSIPF